MRDKQRAAALRSITEQKRKREKLIFSGTNCGTRDYSWQTLFRTKKKESSFKLRPAIAESTGSALCWCLLGKLDVHKNYFLSKLMDDTVVIASMMSIIKSLVGRHHHFKMTVNLKIFQTPSHHDDKPQKLRSLLFC